MTDRQPDDTDPLETAAADIAFAERAKVHLWVTRLDFRTDPTVLDFLGSDDDGALEGTFDIATLMRPPQVTCIICGVAYDPRLRDRKCPGRRRVGGYPVRSS